MAGTKAELSVIMDSGYEGSNNCGYCGGYQSSRSHGMTARNLTAYAYQDLIDQGWRRSGRYLYKPDLARSCCKAYTIRLDVEEFKPDKGQRRLLRKWRDFLADAAPVAALREAQNGPTDGTEAPSAPRDGGGTAAAVPPDMSSPPNACTPPGAMPSSVGAQEGPAASHQQNTSAEADPPGDLAAPMPGDGLGPLLQQVLAAALADAVRAGELPSDAYAEPAVRHCTAKQRQMLSADVLFTSAAAFTLAAAAARQKAAANEPSMALGPGPGPGSAPAGASEGASATPTSEPYQAISEQQQQQQQQQQRRQRKQLQQQLMKGGGISAQDVAHTLARRFNNLVASATAAATSATGGLEDGSRGCASGAADAARSSGAAPMQLDVAGAEKAEPPGINGAQSGGGLSAAASQLLQRGGALEAYAANGHINFRLAMAAATADAAGAAGAEGVAAAPVGREGREHGGLAAMSGDRSEVGAAASTGGTGPRQKRRTAASVSIAAAGADRRSGGMEMAEADAGAAGAREPARGPGDSESLELPSGRLEIRLVRSAFSEEEFQLWSRYQATQHGDSPSELSRWSYRNFLVDSPLRWVSRQEDDSAPECGYGSFHQQYWLDGKLVAVGVVDVLPRCLSSVYLFWDTSLSALALGRFTALQEIRWVQRHCVESPNLHYYYMGFYIHTCPKMRYKADYRPSDLLCPIRKVWVRITRQLLEALDRKPYLELSAEEGAHCQPNLAAPPAATAQQQGGTSAGQQQHAQQHAEPRMAANSLEPHLPVGDTLVLLSGEGGQANAVTLQVLLLLNIIPRGYMDEIERAIRTWRTAVGWAAPSLVYEL